VWAWRLARGGAQVWRLARQADAEAHVRVSGLEAGQALVPRVGLADLERLRQFDFVVVTVKAFQLSEMLSQLRPLLSGQETWVLCQNGLGIGELARSVLPSTRFARAVSWFGAGAQGLDAVELRGAGRVDLAEAPIGQLETLREALHRGGQALGQPRPWAEVEWRKALLNLAINAVCGIEGVRNGEVLRGTPLRARVAQLLSEALAVARVAGIVWDEAKEAQAVWDAIQSTANNENSTLQDLRAGRPTEVPWLNGTLARMGRELGVLAEAHEKVARQVADLEARGQKSVANPAGGC
jgi:2-dehydropantoate 2-reductase